IVHIGPEPISAKELPTADRRQRSSHLAVVLANNLGAIGYSSPLPHVGAVPILLRSILSAAKAGARRIVVVIDRAKGSRIRQDLLKTGRVPNNVEWAGWISGEDSLPSLIAHVSSEIDGHIVLIAGD